MQEAENVIGIQSKNDKNSLKIFHHLAVAGGSDCAVMSVIKKAAKVGA